MFGAHRAPTATVVRVQIHDRHDNEAAMAAHCRIPIKMTTLTATLNRFSVTVCSMTVRRHCLGAIGRFQHRIDALNIIMAMRTIIRSHLLCPTIRNATIAVLAMCEPHEICAVQMQSQPLLVLLTAWAEFNQSIRTIRALDRILGTVSTRKTADRKATAAIRAAAMAIQAHCRTCSRGRDAKTQTSRIRLEINRKRPRHCAALDRMTVTMTITTSTDLPWICHNLGIDRFVHRWKKMKEKKNLICCKHLLNKKISK